MAATRVALEVTEESVRAVEATTGRKQQVIACGEVPLPRDAARDSEVLDQDVVAAALRQLWTVARIKSKSVTLGIGSRRTLVREYTTQAMAPDVLRQALPYQVQDLLPVPVAQAVLDFYPISQQGDQVTGLLVAAVAETIEDIIAATTKAKLHVDAVDLVPFGLARIARGFSAPGSSIGMVHLGDHTTHVVIAVDGVPTFVRIIPLDLPTAAARREETFIDAAAFEPEMETAFAGMPTAGSTGTRTRAGLRTTPSGADPVISDLVGRLRSTLSFYGSRPGAAPISMLHVSGAGALVPGVTDALGRGIDIPTTTLRLTDVSPGARPASDEMNLNLLALSGLVMGDAR